MIAFAAAALLALLPADLPRPPERVFFQSKVGDVTFDHAFHLDQRGGCRACHGQGPVGKIAVGGKAQGHKLCIGCHEAQGGPQTTCAACHAFRTRAD